jgi:predicted ribosome quality control (RQC) complex YloA/Tae2 family protein
MRRLPRRGEVSGGHYAPGPGGASIAGCLFPAPGPPPPSPAPADKQKKEYEVRTFTGEAFEGRSFNEQIDYWYAEHGGALSLEALREQARRIYQGSLGRLEASLERLRAKAADYEDAERLKEYGDIILANMGSVKSGDSWLEAENFYSGGMIRIPLDPRKGPVAQAEGYYERYRKAKTGLEEVQAEIRAGEGERKNLEEAMARLLEETNPLRIRRLIKTRENRSARSSDRKRPGLAFRVRDWLILVGRDGAENDALLRKYVKGNDLWLHARDFPGSYVFVKQRPGKSVPLDILLDAGSLAIFYSKGRNNGEGDLFYTPVKYLRRAKNGRQGLVIPTQEKNLRVRLDGERLRELEQCRVEK